MRLNICNILAYVYVHAAESISVSARSLNATNILVNWTIPVVVSSQGLSSFSVSAVSECANGVSNEPVHIVIDDENVTMINIGGLGKCLGCGMNSMWNM